VHRCVFAISEWDMLSIKALVVIGETKINDIDALETFVLATENHQRNSIVSIEFL